MAGHNEMAGGDIPLRSKKSLESLVKECREGDPDAWAALVDRFQALVYSIPIKHGLGADDAADVFQTTFQTLHANLNQIRNDATLAKWLAVTAARESLKVLRIKRRTVDSDDFSLEQVVANEDSNAESSAIESWQAVAVREAVDKMTGRCKELVALLYFEELAYDEITARMGIPIGAIGPTRARCLDKLRKLLENQGFFE